MALISNSNENDWMNLPNLVSSLILDKFVKSTQVVNFGLVCKQWHFASEDYIHTKRNLQRKSLPMLLIPTKRGRKKKTRKLYCVNQEKFICNVPVGSNKKFCGSSYGWLAYSDENRDITLVNPFQNGITIHLPSLHLLSGKLMTPNYWYNVDKVVLSTDPTLYPQSYIVMVIFGALKSIAYIKAGEESWTPIDKENLDWKLTLFSDITIHRGLVYAVTLYGKLICFNINAPHEEVNVLRDPGISRSIFINKTYLVESSRGELLLVERYYDDWTNWTKTFKVYNLLIDDRDGHLVGKVELKSIGGDALFVGYNCSMAISDLNFLKNCRDSIYFTDDFHDHYLEEFYGDRDIGIFNIKDGSKKHLYAYKSSQKWLPPILWIVPPFDFFSSTTQS
ncbi:hypothetical protein ACFE04_009884 [Oxalis oulophora]